MWKTWKEYTYTDQEIIDKTYQEGIGGGSREWNSRGKLQLIFLQKVGLQPYHVLIDIGCGPLRAGEYFINYLNTGNYIGFDYNQTYIRIAKQIIDTKDNLKEKNPFIFCAEQFDTSGHPHLLGDFGIAFSVLNHCNQNEVIQFFKNIGKSFKSQAKLYTLNSNPLWYPHWFIGKNFIVTNEFDTVKELGIDINQYFIGLENQLTGPGKKFAIEFTKK